MTKDAVGLGRRLKDRRKERDLGLRETARALEVSASFLTDVEKGNRLPTDEKLQALARFLDLDIAELRVLANRADSVVHDVATQDKLTADKVPSFLRLAKDLDRDQWDKLIEQARDMTTGRSRKR
ncbi:MAG: helix-turn-helix transcriptional regulator [Phycisphaerae bacterium]|nr:helix-turn-helix transcriptional regulator [Phycisphaerae bacterium]